MDRKSIGTPAGGATFQVLYPNWPLEPPDTLSGAYQHHFRILHRSSNNTWLDLRTMAEAATDPDHVDVVIVGAGIAGCALAAALAADGRRVRVFERDMTVPDTFRGELLQPAGLTRLQELGLGRTTQFAK